MILLQSLRAGRLKIWWGVGVGQDAEAECARCIQWLSGAGVRLQSSMQGQDLTEGWHCLLLYERKLIPSVLETGRADGHTPLMIYPTSLSPD